MHTKNFRSIVAAIAVAAALGSASVLYAADDLPSFDDGITATCSSGTSDVCRTESSSTTTCLEWVPVSANGSVSVGGGGIGVTFQCRTSKVTTVTSTYHWSK